MKNAPAPKLPPCPRCGIDNDLRSTRAHRPCIRAARREERAENRRREREAREYMRRVAPVL